MKLSKEEVSLRCNNLQIGDTIVLLSPPKETLIPFGIRWSDGRNLSFDSKAKILEDFYKNFSNYEFKVKDITDIKHEDSYAIRITLMTIDFRTTVSISIDEFQKYFKLKASLVYSDE